MLLLLLLLLLTPRARAAGHQSSMRSPWILLCVAGCVSQVSVLTIGYFSYDISSTVSYTSRDEITLPDITFCTYLIDLLEWRDARLSSICSRLLPPPHAGNCSRLAPDEMAAAVAGSKDVTFLRESGFLLFNQFPIGTLINLTSGIDWLFPGLLITDRESEELVAHPLTDVFRTSSFIRGLNKCFTLAWRSAFAHRSYQEIRRQVVAPGLLVYLLRSVQHQVHLLAISFSEAGSKVRIDRSDSLLIPSQGLSSSTYEKIESHLLPPPFQTDCRNYQESGLTDRSECFERCYSRNVSDTFGKRPPGMRFEVTDDKIHGMTNAFAKAHKGALDAAWHACQAACRQHDCHQVTYVSRLKSASQATEGVFPGHMVHVNTAPDVRSESLAKMTLSEFLADVASTLGFWLGVSVLQLGDSFSRSRVFAFLRQKARQALVSECLPERKQRRKLRRKQQPSLTQGDWVFVTKIR